MTNKPARLANTHIFVACDPQGNQLTVYQNNAESQTKNAMILPVPLIAGVELLNMEDFKNIFKELSNYFPKMMSYGLMGGLMSNSRSAKTLKIHYVGSYQASIVESLVDFERLDTSFRLNPTVKEILQEHYPQFGFIVCQLLEGKKDYEPFAYRHKTIGGKVFVPTRHYHGEGPPETSSDWDHEIYSVGCLSPDSQHSARYSDEVAELCKYAGVNINDTYLSKLEISGHHENYDVVFYPKPSDLELNTMITKEYLSFEGPDGCKFYSNVEGLTFDGESDGSGTKLFYNKKPLQASRFIDFPLVIVGQRVVCYDLGDGFLVKGMVSGNLWTYYKNQQNYDVLIMNA